MSQQRSDEPFINIVSASLDEVPMALGTVAMAVIKLMSDHEVSLDRLARAISSDQGLSARIIRKANSAFYATGNRITTLPLAIMKIGFSATRSIAISASVNAMFRKGEGDGLEQQLWYHSLAVGIGSRILAKRVGSRAAEEAFLTGLLHDIGKLVLLQRYPEQYTPILRETQNKPNTRLDVELSRMGFTHADLGVMVLDRWNFAESEIRAVQYHHDPYAMPDSDANNHDLSSTFSLAQIVALANLLAKSMEQTAGPHSSPVERLKSDHFDFPPNQLIEIAEEIRQNVSDELQVFGLTETRLF